MPAKALVLIEVVPGKIFDILKGLKEIPEVKTAEAVSGPFDIVARTEADTLPELEHVNYVKIQKIGGVLRILPLNVITVLSPPPSI